MPLFLYSFERVIRVSKFYKSSLRQALSISFHLGKHSEYIWSPAQSVFGRVRHGRSEIRSVRRCGCLSQVLLTASFLRAIISSFDKAFSRGLPGKSFS